MIAYNFYQVSPLIGTCGYLEEDSFDAIASEGYNIVINLAMHDAPNAILNESELVNSAGMTYIHIPVPMDAPKEEHYEAFEAIMNSFKGRKILVHCQVNARVSAFMYRYMGTVSPILKKWLPSMDNTWKELLGLDKSNL